MAEQEQKDDIDIVSEEKSNPKLLIIIIAVLLLAIIGLGAMIFWAVMTKILIMQMTTLKNP